MIRRRAPAKLNLYLRVLGRRPDGYHEIETIFERINLADELTFESAPSGISLTCDDPALSCGEDNLVIKAARLLQQVGGARPHTKTFGVGASIHLTKRIPIAAGLGGGSSDAAATLMGLNELWKLNVARPQLLELAATLGSDVPFFLHEAPVAIGRGRGERCETLATDLHLVHVLVIPHARLSTKEIYAAGDFNLTASKPSITMVVHALSNGSLGELADGLLWNDLQPEAIRRCPAITVLQAQLRDQGCVGVGLSGSGPSVFGLCRDLAHAQDVAVRLRNESAFPRRIEIIQTDSPSIAVTPSAR